MLLQLWSIPAVKGALSGAVVLAGHDLYTWSQSDDPFNWRKAIKKWLGGALVGSGLFGLASGMGGS